MKKKYLILLICLISPYLRSEIAFTQIKGLYKQLPDDKKHLSPVHGFNWWKTGIIENFWQFGNQNHNTIKLINDLFYLQPDGVTFDITTLNSKPAKYFTPAIIGKILAIIDHHTTPLSPDEQEGLTVALFDSIKRMLNFDQLVMQAQQQIGDAQQELAQLKVLGQTRVKLQKNIISNQRLLKQLQTNLTKQENEKAAQTQARIQTVQKEMAAAHDEIEDVKQRLSQRKKLEKIIRNNNLTHASLRKLVASIVGSLKETLKEKYVPYTTHQILLAFLWNLVNDKTEFASYFAQVGIPITATDLQQTPYTQAEFKEFKRALKSNPELVTSNYPLNSFVGFANRVWGDNKLPLLITSIGDAIYQADGQKYDFADCGETSLRNFFNILIYNPAAGSLDFALLAQTAARNSFTLNPQLVAYYQTYNDITKIQTKPYYDAWAQLVSGLPGVDYENEPGYEISAGLNNMMKVVNHLLFNNDEEFDALLNDEKLDYLIEKLSRPGFSLTWKAKKSTDEDAPDWDEDADDENGDHAASDDSSEYSDSDSSSSDDDEEEQVNINRQNKAIKIIFTINKKIKFIWGFGSNHFTITKPQKGSQTSTDIALAAANLSAVLGEQRLNNANVLCWYVTEDNLYPVTDQMNFFVSQSGYEGDQYLQHSINSSYKILITMALNLRMNETLQNAIKYLLAMLSGDTLDQQLIQNLIKRLPTNDGFHADRLGLSIVAYNADFLYPMLDTMPIGGNTIQLIIEYQKKHFYPLAKQKLQHAYDTWDQMEDAFDDAQPYLDAISSEEFNEFPENEKFKALYQPLLEIYYATQYVYHDKSQLPAAQRTLEATLSQPLTPQIDKQLQFLAEALVQKLYDNSHDPYRHQFYPMLISIINKTNNRETIAYTGETALEYGLDQLYEPLHKRVVSNPDFHDLILGIIKTEGAPLYKTVREVVAKTDDVELLAKTQAAIRQKQIEELYSLADEIQERLTATGKERDEGGGSAAATTTTTTTSFIQDAVQSAIQFVQNLFGQVARKLTL